MLKSDLKFAYPEHLVATEKKPVSRVMWAEKGDPREVTISHVISQLQPGDVFVINESRVIPARVVDLEYGIEVLFISDLGQNQWQVLCPLKKWPKGETLILPDGIEVDLVQRGLPQKIQLNKNIDASYFEKNGEMPLPPYIQQARGERRQRAVDRTQYQADWAKTLGSLAAPTASLHFCNEDLQKISARGAQVVKICLHVGLGTFLPIHSDDLNDHVMHKEFIEIHQQAWQQIEHCRNQGGRVWALGSTVTRAIESQSRQMLELVDDRYVGESDLFIQPGVEYQVVDVLLTNFHQPESTLIAMVMAFAGVDQTKNCYQWAIDRSFRLFSYGDLSVWTR